MLYLSRLVRALWIEIVPQIKQDVSLFVEARESLVDWNLRDKMRLLDIHRSRLVRALWIEIELVRVKDCKVSRRGSWEPCGLKFVRSNAISVCPVVEARESLVDWNKILIHYILNGFVEARESLVDWNPPTLRLANRIYPSRLVRALWIEISE